MNHFCAIKVGMTALAMTTPTKIEYWVWSMIPAVRPKTLEMVPKVSPVLIRRVVYILPFGIYLRARKYTPRNFVTIFSAKRIRKRPNAEAIMGTETFRPPTIKKTGVTMAQATVRSRFFTTLFSDD